MKEKIWMMLTGVLIYIIYFKGLIYEYDGTNIYLTCNSLAEQLSTRAKLTYPVGLMTLQEIYYTDMKNNNEIYSIINNVTNEVHIVEQ